MEKYRVLSGRPWWNARIKSQDYGAANCDPAVWAHMRENGLSLVVCSRQIGRVTFLSAGPDEGECFSSVLPLAGAMGAWVDGGTMILGGADGVSVLRDISSSDPHTSVFIPVKRHRTGNLGIHDVSWLGGASRIRFVNTMFSSICELDDVSGFRTVWRPRVVEEDGPCDCVHMNGMAINPEGGTVVTMLGSGGGAAAWRESGPDEGVLYGVADECAISTSLSLPHSPLWSDGQLWFLESGKGLLCQLDVSGKKRVRKEFDGLARGLSIVGSVAAVGLSPVRRTSGGTSELLKQRFGDRRSCEVAVVDVASRASLGGVFLPDVPEISSVHWHRKRAVLVATPASEEDASYFTFRESASRAASGSPLLL